MMMESYLTMVNPISGNLALFMTTAAFKASLTGKQPPADVSPALAALWYAGKGDWDKAHIIAQDIPTRDGAWVHAWLHRKEGDEGNAHYWYSRAGRKMPALSLEDEWAEIVEAML
jgi:hypothetical protein